jgi:hypothetical protein
VIRWFLIIASSPQSSVAFLAGARPVLSIERKFDYSLGGALRTEVQDPGRPYETFIQTGPGTLTIGKVDERV